MEVTPPIGTKVTTPTSRESFVHTDEGSTSKGVDNWFYGNNLGFAHVIRDCVVEV